MVIRYFLFGLFTGIGVFLVIFFLLYPQYSDYLAKAETGAWLTFIKSIQDDVEKKADDSSFLNTVVSINNEKFQTVGIDMLYSAASNLDYMR
jgi:hypothetical protein